MLEAGEQAFVADAVNGQEVVPHCDGDGEVGGWVAAGYQLALVGFGAGGFAQDCVDLGHVFYVRLEIDDLLGVAQLLQLVDAVQFVEGEDSGVD